MSLKTLIGTVATNAASDENILNKAYDDIIHPAAQNVEQALDTLTSTINILLAPFSWAVYGFDIIDSYVKEGLVKTLSKISPENLSNPEPNIVIPAYEALRYSLDKEDLRKMYINLIASSMLNEKKDKVHPAFVEIIKQLSTTDAKLLYNMFNKSKLQIPKIKALVIESFEENRYMNLFSSILPQCFYTENLNPLNCECSLENLERLKLIEITDYDISKNDVLMSINSYQDININFEPLNRFKPSTLKTINGNISLTSFGLQFIETVF